MGTTLTGTQINNTYSGLLKTADNAVLGATEKIMGDGAGNDSTLSLGTASASFSGTLALGSATITGLDGLAPAGGTTGQILEKIDGTDYNYQWADASGGGGGLVLGTGSATQEGAPLSMISGSAVTTIAALARGGGDIAIGDGAATKLAGATWPSSSIAIGHDAETTAEKAIAIGRNATTQGEKAVSLGWNVTADTMGVAIGRDTDTGAASAVAIGDFAGYLGPFAATSAVMIGHDNGFSAGANSVSLGFNTTGKATDSIAIGNDARVDSSAHTAAICIGEDTRSSAAGTVSLGRNVTAVNWVDSTTVNQFAIANYASINYADDTAAATGGVPLGGVYHTDGAMKIRIA